jgi:UDP-N-acetylmuramoyl-L-alanyl-D-glutamate--2,6-diaminopimelate ligase
VPATPDGTTALRPSSPPRRPLSELPGEVPGLRVVGSLDGVYVTGCTHDSRAVQPGDLYAALPGARAHGADFADEVTAAGAVAVLTDDAGARRFPGLPVLIADDPRHVLGAVARWVHDDPAADLLLLGVTGTNGKTTTAFLLEAGLRAAGHTTALLGTVLTRIGDDVLPSIRTTPEATDLHAMFAVMRERGVTAVAMEVSSHALALGRVDGLVFDIAAFTNLSQDHLDFHPTMADYEAAKAALFTPRRSRQGVVNCDDPAGRRIVHAALVPTITYGEDADWSARQVDLRPDGSTFRLHGPFDVDVRVDVRLPGAFNVANAVCAIATMVTAGVPLENAVSGIGGVRGVPGRMERVDAGQPFLALVDYAHTPDAVATLLNAVRAITQGRVIVVLGAGGDRDRAKRPLMGRAAVEGADVVYLTSDNPRGEDPLVILAEMSAGAPGAVVEPDRRAAIEAAVRTARAGDAVVVAGKGHETGQEVAGVVTPFDDRVVLREALS